MPNFNQQIVVGHLGADPEVREVGNGVVANMRVAAKDSWVQDGERKERTDWIPVTIWGKLAERCRSLSKGDGLIAVGKFRTRKWQDKNGNDRYTSELNADWVWPLAKFDADDDAPF